MQQGYIKLYRKILDSPVWSDPYYLKLWLYCLLKATHRERKVIHGNQVITLQPGQFLTGRISLAEDLNKDMKPKLRLSERTWYRYLENLEKWQMLSIKKTNKYSIVSINKWKEYQETDQQLTNNCPSNDHQMSTNKNVKNDKNVKNNISTTTSDVSEKEDAIIFYQENIGMITPSISDEMLAWIDDFGDEMVIEALRRSINRNKASWGYALSILRSWKRKNIKTIEQAKAEEIEFSNQQLTRYKNNSFSSPAKKEIIPDWFYERKSQKDKPLEEQEQKIVEMERILQKYKKTGGEET